jgi:adenylate kinase
MNELKHTRKNKRVILVTGTPGVGKTAIACMLASSLGADYVNLGELVERENLIFGVDEERGTLIADTGKVSKMLKKIIEASDRDVIVDGHYAVDVVPAERVHLVFVLRRGPDELKGLMERRGFRERKLWENIAAEILDVCLWDAVKACGSEKVCEVDASGKSAPEVLEEINFILEGKRTCRVGTVDWLGKLEKEGRLSEFFKVF